MAKALRWTAFGIMALTSVFFGAFLVGETLSDPGGWTAVLLITAWAVPLVALCALAWWRPRVAQRVLGVLTGVLIAASVWFTIAPSAWRSVENQHGPVRAVAVWVVAAPVAVLGLKLGRAAGVLLLLAGGIPLVLSGLGGGHGGFGSLGAAVTPALVSGLLYLLAASVDPRQADGGGISPAEEARSGR